MSETITLNVASTFPEGTTVGAYPALSQTSGGSGAPRGPATTSAVVTTGHLTYTGLENNTDYLGIGSVSGAFRAVGFRVEVVHEAGGGGGGEPSGPAGGVLSGQYPDPTFFEDMATQAELNAAQGLGTGTVLNGHGPPDNGTGNDGDFYIEVDSDPPVIYGPKNLGDWGEPITIGGGAMLSGSGVPDDGLGSEGDFYLDEDTNLLYGPKGPSVWGTPIDLTASTTGGPAGGVLSGVYPNPTFAQDMATQTELDSLSDDVDNIVGVPILAGTTVPSPADGTDGSYFFDTSSGNLYGPKTAGEWPEPVLLDGLEVLTGVTTPTNDLGGDGDYFLQTNNSTMYGPKLEGEWPAGVSFKGDQGDPGGTFAPQGAWASGTTYDQYDTATKAGSTWLSEANSNTNHDPTTDDGTYWTLVAGRGNQGPSGSGLLPGLMIPAGAQRPMVASVMNTSQNSGYFAHMNPVPQDGTLTDMAVYVGTASGNFKLLVYDTGDTASTAYSLIYQGPATAAVGASWNVITGVALDVLAGDRLVFGVVPDNATVQFGRADTATSTGAATLPAAFSPPIGACRVKLGATKGGLTYASPATSLSEGNMTAATIIPMILGMVS